MKVFLSRFIPFMLSGVISFYIFSIIDRQCNFLDKSLSKLKIRKQWQSTFIVTSSLTIIFAIGLFGTYIVDMSNEVFNVISGMPFGVVMYASNKLNPKKVK